MNKTEEKMSIMERSILFAVLAMIIFFVVIMEKESQEKEVHRAEHPTVDSEKAE